MDLATRVYHCEDELEKSKNKLDYLTRLQHSPDREGMREKIHINLKIPISYKDLREGLIEEKIEFYKIRIEEQKKAIQQIKELLGVIED